MSFKIISRIFIILVIMVASFGCKDQNRIVLPVCEGAIALDQDGLQCIFNTDRPKVVTFSNIHCMQMIDLALLQKQVNRNPDFDFLFYVLCDNDECRTMLEHFVHDNDLHIVLFIDRNDDYRRANNLQNSVSYSSVITGSNLSIYGVTMVGSPYSAFDNVILEARARLNL